MNNNNTRWRLNLLKEDWIIVQENSTDKYIVDSKEQQQHKMEIKST